MARIKIFSGSEILAMSLKAQLETLHITVVSKDNIQSGRMGGYGTSDLAVELFIEQSDYGKAHSVIEAFRLSI